MSDLAEKLKNGTAFSGAPACEPPAELLAFAQSLVDGVRSGQITTLLAVTVGPSGNIGWPAWGPQGDKLLLGAEFFRDDGKAMMRSQGKPGKIIRAG
jgi:hypothetical protein